ncbi:MAG: hypothetical protein M1834_004997 [Cirrosporium novae-zelandiae]|nr:MAG: hypothetical protein M1834_004997 [Cirrosporium novae-zelandiae]
MGTDQNLIETLDGKLNELFADWNIYTTIIATVVCLFIVYPWFSGKEPDIHPLLLARQAAASYVRQPGYSAVYRSLEVPPGYPLRTGLNVKDPGAPKWSGGKDGDLRDVWRQAVRGPTDQKGEPKGSPGKIITVLGSQKVREQNLNDISKEINVIGQHIQAHGGQRVAVWLSNSVELLATIFAGSFYGFCTILLPYEPTSRHLIPRLGLAKVEVLVAEAGTVELSAVAKEYPNIKQVIWVVKEGSRHIPWGETPSHMEGKIDVSAWHEVVEDLKEQTSAELPQNSKENTLPTLEAFWTTSQKEVGQLFAFSQKNLVAAIAALMAALPRNQRLNSSDLFLPIDSLSYSYPLTLTMAALFSNCSIALNSVSGPDTDFLAAISSLEPTVVVASASTIANVHSKLEKQGSSLVHKMQRRLQQHSFDAGYMPSSSVLATLVATDAAVAKAVNKLRLLLISKRSSTELEPSLNPDALSNLRAALDTRIIYALTSGKVAGAIAQTHCFDYRRQPTGSKGYFGAPLSSVEILLKDKGEYKTTDEEDPKGEVIVQGPAVIDREVNLGILGTLGNDNGLSEI